MKTLGSRILVYAIFVLAAAVISSCMTDSPALAQEDASGSCMTCHREKSPGLYNQWYTSKHAEAGVTCLECHQADESDADAFQHYPSQSDRPDQPGKGTFHGSPGIVKIDPEPFSVGLNHHILDVQSADQVAQFFEQQGRFQNSGQFDGGGLGRNFFPPQHVGQFLSLHERHDFIFVSAL